MRTAVTFVFALFAGALAAGCATTAEAPPPSQFPTRDALQKIAASPPPTKISGESGLAADGWQLTGPLPDSIEPMQYADGTPWQAMLAEVAGARPGLVAMPASMHCVAQETGLFYLEKQAMPAERLARFIAGRCGAVAADVHVASLGGAVPDGIPLERIAQQYRPQIVDGLQKLLGSGVLQAGIWLGQSHGKAVVMMSVAVRRANLDTLSLLPAADGKVTVRGELLEPAEHLQAVFNRGHYGFGRCSTDPTVALPRFAVTCDVDPTDDAAWIEIAAFAAGRIVGHIVASLAVFPSQKPATAYHDAGYVTHAAPAGNGGDARNQLLALLNEVRRGAGLGEVTLAARECEVADKIGPHYFAALVGQESELVADEVVLGLRAGWEVDGEVLDGEFTAGALARSDDLGQLLDAVLERPSGRAALLERTARQVAFGAVIAPAERVIAMVASSYSMFEGSNAVADAQRVMGRLTKARIDQRLAPPLRFPAVQPDLDDGAALVQKGELSPHQALQRMLRRSVERVVGTGFRGWMFEVSSIDDIRFPPDLVRGPIGGVTIAVTHYHPKNGPWSRLVVFILAAGQNGGLMTASR